MVTMKMIAMADRSEVDATLPIVNKTDAQPMDPSAPTVTAGCIRHCVASQVPHLLANKRHKALTKMM